MIYMATRIKNKFNTVRTQLFQEITIAEYVSWWIVRALLLIAVITAPDPNRMLTDFVNMLAAYALPLLRLIAPEKSFISKVDFRCQHYLNFMEFAGIFLGHCLNVYELVPKYDRLLHAISGPVAVFAAYYIYKAYELKEGDGKYRIKPGAATFASFSFSFVIIVFWEITEFLGDYFFGSYCQGYHFIVPADDIWFRIFGPGFNGGVQQFPLWDTMMDMIDATLATFGGALVLYLVLRHLRKRDDARALTSEAETVSA